MSQIKCRNTKPEIQLRKILWAMGLRYRLKSKVAGKPDMVFAGKMVAVFVDGCQWHSCPEHWVRPKSNTQFWDTKFEKNRNRDVAVNLLLTEQGWTVLRFWEHEVEKHCDNVANRIFHAVMIGTPGVGSR